MIPILYDRTETSFTSNGLGRLSSCIRCIVTEERNEVYECEFDYPVTGVLFSEIEEGRIIACTHDEQGDVQPFDIYGRSEPINGVVTFYAHHISYRQNEITVKPFTAGSATEAIAKIKSQSINTNPFTYWTNKSVTASFTSEAPKNARDLLMGEEGSMLDVFGTGEYEFDKFNVKLYLHRGQDTNVSIRYGKNLADFQNEYDVSEAYTAVVPYWLGEVSEGEESVQMLVMLPELFISSGHSVPSGREVVVPMDLSDEFEDAPTVSELRSTATSRLNSSDAWEANQTVTVDFVQLWQTEEYKEYAPLQRLKLCDTCGVFVPMYDTALRAKVIKVVYNVLLDRYDEMELGDKPTSYAAVLEKQYDSKVAGVEAGLKAITVDLATVQTIAANDATTKANNAKTQANNYTDGQIASAKSTIESQYEQAIEDATELIRGGTGGYVVTTVNANGQPIELLITDNLDLTQAVNVWRWNQGGLAHSSNGYNGQFNDVAITADGKINASMILTGALTANLITAGTITDVDGENYWNLDTGEFVTQVGTIGPYEIRGYRGLTRIEKNQGNINKQFALTPFYLYEANTVYYPDLSRTCAQRVSLGGGSISFETIPDATSFDDILDSGTTGWSGIGSLRASYSTDEPNGYLQFQGIGGVYWVAGTGSYPFRVSQKTYFYKDVVTRGNYYVYNGSVTHPIVKSGTTSFSNVASGSYADVTITHGFGVVPNIVASLKTAGTAANMGNVSVSVASVTATQATIRLFNNRPSSAGAISPNVTWIATV